MTTLTVKKGSWYHRPPQKEIPGYIHTDLHDDIVDYVKGYGALTLPMLYWLVYNAPLTGAKKRDVDKGIIQDPRYRYLAKQVKKLSDTGEIRRSQGLREVTYALRVIKQNRHWLDRAWLRMTLEFLCRQHPEFQYEWENEQGMRTKPGIADCRIYLRHQRATAIDHYRYRVEIDRGNREPWELRDQFLAHMEIFREHRVKYRGTPEYQPWRILFSTNNRKNILGDENETGKIPDEERHALMLYGS